MPAFLIPLAMMAASAISGAIKNKGQKPATSSTQSTNSSMPTLAPEYKSLQDAILPSITKRLSNPTGLPAGYLENGLASINETHDAAKLGLENDLVSRGLNTSPVAGNAMSIFNRGRAADITKFRNTLPMVEREFQNQDLETAMQAMQLGRGQTSTGNSSGQAQAPQQGKVSSAIDSVSSMLGWLYGNGSFGGGAAKAAGGVPAAAKNLSFLNFRGM